MKVYAIVNHHGTIECYLSSKTKAAAYILALFNENHTPLKAHDNSEPWYRAQWYHESDKYPRSFFLSKNNICNLEFVINGLGYDVRAIEVE